MAAIGKILREEDDGEEGRNTSEVGMEKIVEDVMLETVR
jgi:hypothetical protein